MISISVSMEMWCGGRKNGAPTSGFSLAPRPDGSFERSRKQLCLVVCALTTAALEKMKKQNKKRDSVESSFKLCDKGGRVKKTMTVKMYNCPSKSHETKQEKFN